MLELEQFGIQLDRHAILSPFSLKLEIGQCVGILGANGSGKSTLLKAIGQNIPYQGRVFWQQKDLASYCVQQRAQLMAFMPQSSSLNFAFKVIEIVRMGTMMYQLEQEFERNLIFDVMQRFDVLDLAEVNYLKLSGGEKQRVHAARTWVQVLASEREKLVMLDEPTSALDLKHQHQLLQQVQRLAKNHLVLIVLHDLNLASRYCDHLLLFQKGKFFTFGRTEDVMTKDNIHSLYAYQAELYSYNNQLCVW